MKPRQMERPNKNEGSENFPGGPVVKDSALPLQGGTDSIPGQGTKIPPVIQSKCQVNKRKGLERWPSSTLSIYQCALVNRRASPG